MKRLLPILALVVALSGGAAIADDHANANAQSAAAMDHSGHQHEAAEPWSNPALWQMLKTDVNALAGILALTAAVRLVPRRRREREVAK